eukprot:scaffold7340_cov266-Pinguiococcus_pyrenoidosus.AAC.85
MDLTRILAQEAEAESTSDGRTERETHARESDLKLASEASPSSSREVEYPRSSGRQLPSPSTRGSKSHYSRQRAATVGDEEEVGGQEDHFSCLCLPCTKRTSKRDETAKLKTKVDARRRNYFYDKDGILRFEDRAREHDPDAELSILRDLGSGDSAWDVSEELFVVSSKWVESWVSFVRDRNCQPGPIDNHLLLETGEDIFKPDLKAVEHYRVVNAKTWEHLLSLYGGGPRITLKAPSEAMMNREEALDRSNFWWLADTDLNRDASVELSTSAEPDVLSPQN